jgi:hypothetical protein
MELAKSAKTDAERDSLLQMAADWLRAASLAAAAREVDVSQS